MNNPAFNQNNNLVPPVAPSTPPQPVQPVAQTPRPAPFVATVLPDAAATPASPLVQPPAPEMSAAAVSDLYANMTPQATTTPTTSPIQSASAMSTNPLAPVAPVADKLTQSVAQPASVLTPETPVLPDGEPVKEDAFTQESFAPPVAAVPAGPKFVGGVLVDDTPPPAAPIAPAEKTASDTEASKVLKPDLPAGQAEKKGGVPVPVFLIVIVVLLVLAGGGLFYFYQMTHNEIEQLQVEKTSLTNQVTGLTKQTAQAKIDALAALDQPIFVDSSGVFSFYQKFAGLTVTNMGGEAKGKYGSATDGFDMTASSALLNGKDLSTVVDEKMSTASAGVLAYDKRPETLGTYTGFSYVVQAGETLTIHYLFVMNDQSTHYFELSYTIAAASDEAFLANEEVVMKILGSVKLYQ